MSNNFLQKVDTVVQTVKPLKALVGLVAERVLPTKIAYAAEYEECSSICSGPCCSSCSTPAKLTSCRTCVVHPGGSGCGPWSTAVHDGCC